MTNEEIKKIVAIVMQEVEHHKRQLVQQECDRRFQDVKLLLKNYKKLKKHYEHADADIDSITRTASETRTMMEYVDKMLNVYETLCINGVESDRIRWRVVQLCYLSDPKNTVSHVADMLSMDDSTVYRHLRDAYEDMAVLLFGIEAIGTWKKQGAKK